jgi:hypothetical protein
LQVKVSCVSADVGTSRDLLLIPLREISGVSRQAPLARADHGSSGTFAALSQTLSGLVQLQNTTLELFAV